MKRSDTHTHTHSNKATQQRMRITAHCRSGNSRSNLHGDIPKHSAAATHTTTLHSQHARQQSNSTQRQHTMAHPRPRAMQQRPAQPLALSTHNTSTTVLQSMSALTRQQCDTAPATCTIEGHVSHWCVARTASDSRSHRQHPRNATPHCNAAVPHACMQRSAIHTRAIIRENIHAALCRHTAATAKRGAATHTRQHK
jgi:hypothetical protein